MGGAVFRPLVRARLVIKGGPQKSRKRGRRSPSVIRKRDSGHIQGLLRVILASPWPSRKKQREGARREKEGGPRASNYKENILSCIKDTQSQVGTFPERFCAVPRPLGEGEGRSGLWRGGGGINRRETRTLTSDCVGSVKVRGRAKGQRCRQWVGEKSRGKRTWKVTSDYGGTDQRRRESERHTVYKPQQRKKLHPGFCESAHEGRGHQEWVKRDKAQGGRNAPSLLEYDRLQGAPAGKKFFYVAIGPLYPVALKRKDCWGKRGRDASLLKAPFSRPGCRGEAEEGDPRRRDRAKHKRVGWSGGEGEKGKGGTRNLIPKRSPNFLGWFTVSPKRTEEEI